MRNIKLAATAALFLAAAAPLAAQATTFTFATLDNPADPTFNQLLGINNAGTIAGYFGSTAVGHPNQGYTIKPPYTTFVPDNVPTSVQTQATGINAANTTVGFWSPTNLGMGDANYGFIRWDNGKRFSYLDVNDPLTTSMPPVNQVLGINKSQLAVGFYNDAGGNPHGFVYTVATAKYTPVNIPGTTATAATGINNQNLICGFMVNKAGRTLGFTKPLSGGKALPFSAGHAAITQLLGVNNSGEAVGFYFDSNMIPHGILYDPHNGQWQQVDDPSGVQGTVLNGLNDKNQLVGFYTDAAGNVHGMVVTVSK